jgi:hypothetical protein
LPFVTAISGNRALNHSSAGNASSKNSTWFRAE